MSELATELDPDETDPFLEDNCRFLERISERCHIGKKLKQNKNKNKRVSEPMLPMHCDLLRNKSAFEIDKSEFFKNSKQLHYSADKESMFKNKLSPMKRAITFNRFRSSSKDD